MGRSEEEKYVHQLEDQELVTDAILQAVAEVSENAILELPPLQKSIDVDSINRLFQHSSNMESLQFEYAGWDVTVEPDRISISERS